MYKIDLVDYALAIWAMLNENDEWDEAKPLIRKLNRMIDGLQKYILVTEDVAHVLAVVIEHQYEYLSNFEKFMFVELGFQEELKTQRIKLEEECGHISDDVTDKLHTSLCNITMTGVMNR